MASEEKNRGPGVGQQRQSTSILTGVVVVGCEATRPCLASNASLRSTAQVPAREGRAVRLKAKNMERVPLYCSCPDKDAAHLAAEHQR